MFSYTHLSTQFTVAVIIAFVLSSVASTILSSSSSSSSDQIPLLDDDIISQAYYSDSSLFAFDSLSLIDLKKLMQSDAFKQNMSLTLNISTENLTNLIYTAQLNQTWEFRHQQHSMLVLISLSIFYVLIIVVGVVGNIITCIVIARNKFMHTATNYYLLNLAISDLMLLSSGAPQDVYSYWNPHSFSFSHTVCILASTCAETATNATVLTITAFTVERYIAICHPFRQHTMSKLSRVIKFILAIWLLAVLLALPQALQFSVVVEPSGTLCTIDNDFKDHVFAVSGFIFFVGPMTAICVLYILIGLKLKRSRMLQTAPRRNLDMNRGISSQGRVIRMLFVVAIAFFLCWAPFHAQRLMAVYGSSANIKSQLFKDAFNIVDMISGMMYYLSTCINPLLYNIMSHKFREAFKVTLGRRFGFHGRSQSQSHNYSAMLRQNGSMRFHTTDSIRTTATTTTINSSTGTNTNLANTNNAGPHSSHCSRYVSIGSQSPLTTTTQNKREKMINNQVNGTSSTTASQQHYRLQSQLSQISHRSSGADSNLTFDIEIGTKPTSFNGLPPSSSTPLNSNKSNNFRRSVISNNMNHNELCKGHHINDECESNNSTECENSVDTNCIDELETVLPEEETAPNTRLIISRRPTNVQPMQPIQLVNTIAELDQHAPARTRLKLSRIISRREQDALPAQSSSRSEQMSCTNINVANVPDSPFTTYENDKKRHMHNANGGRKHKTLDALNGIFHWHSRKKDVNGRRSGVGKKRNRPRSSSTTHTHANRIGSATTPHVALMRRTSSAAPNMLDTALNAEEVGQKM